MENKNPVSIAQNALKAAREANAKVLIVDTAGRLSIDEEMMDEIGNIKKALNPQEILFVVDAMTGQDAVNTAKAFNDVLDFTGVILTKLDGDTRGGAALSIKSVVNKPIKFMGMGEKMEALDTFHPDRMAQRILGMGDIVSLVERAQEVFDEQEAEKIQKKLLKDQFTFEDFYTQIQQIKKMGNLKDLMAMIPGVGKAVKDLDISDDAFKGIEAIINSMTPAERKTPDIINGSRRKRIASGSGTDIQQVNQLLKQFEDMRKLMKTMKILTLTLSHHTLFFTAREVLLIDCVSEVSSSTLSFRLCSFWSFSICAASAAFCESIASRSGESCGLRQSARQAASA